MPETNLNNNLRSSNNNTQFERTRGSLCLSPVTSPLVVDNKRKSWCGTPTSQIHSRRYGELANIKMRCDDFPYAYQNKPQNRRSVDMNSPLQSSLPCQLIPSIPAPSTVSLSRESLLSSNSGSDASSELSEEGYGVICDIGLLERIVLSHPIWFLPGIQRAGAFHLLQGKEEGCFVVRKSSQPDTMALSVRLPPDKGPYIEHYLIHNTEGRLALETSENLFVNISALVAHYASCCDELPVQLTLPKTIRESKSRQQLSSLALLGQEFWSYSPPVSAVSSPEVELVLNLNPLMSTFKQPETSTPATLEKPVRPNTLNLFFRNDPSMDSLQNNALMENDSMVKTPPQPPPRWSKPTTPNNFTVTTTVTFSVNAQSPNNGISQESLNVDNKRMSPEGQCISTISSRGSRTSLTRSSLKQLALHGSVTSPQSLTPDTLSPISVSESARHSKRHKYKISKHYQESDIVDSPTVYYRSGLGDKISDYEDLWTNEKNQQKAVNLSSPDILQHTTNTTETSNNNIVDNFSDSHNSVMHRSNCFPCQRQDGNEDNDIKPSTPGSTTDESITPHISKQGSPFYAEPADSLTTVPVPRRIVTRPLETSTSHSVSPPPQSFKLVNFKLKPYREQNEACNSDSKNDAVDADSDFEWLKIPNYLSSIDHGDPDDRLSLQDLILRRFPDLNITSGVAIDKEAYRVSAYDNVDDKRSPRAPLSEISEITEFSDPWAEVSSEVGNISNCDSTPLTNLRVASINKARPARDPSLTVPFPSRNIQISEPKVIGGSIRAYALQLAQDKTTTFAQNIDNFIACTRESKEKNPHVVMRNIRQFMSGMKNYLVKHGEKEFYKEIERERSKLKATEFLNLDVILEEVMNKLVVKPLRTHLQKLFLDYYTKTGAIRLLADSIHYASFKLDKILKPQHRIFVPSDGVLVKISQFLQRLQSAHSPLEKLEYLLAAIAVLFNSVKTEQSTIGKTNQLGADDFLPLLVWVLVKTNFVAAEIECEYMYGLLHQPLLSGEGGYYLTTLSSAIHFLKKFKESCEENTKNHGENDAVLKVVVPDELHGSILTKTLPARPHMTTKDVCKIIAHKARITNPQDYALYRLMDGEEMMLLENECPQDILKAVKHTMLVYKRIDAKIAWPKQNKDAI